MNINTVDYSALPLSISVRSTILRKLMVAAGVYLLLLFTAAFLSFGFENKIVGQILLNIFGISMLFIIIGWPIAYYISRLSSAYTYLIDKSEYLEAFCFANHWNLYQPVDNWVNSNPSLPPSFQPKRFTKWRSSIDWQIIGTTNELPFELASIKYYKSGFGFIGGVVPYVTVLKIGKSPDVSVVSNKNIQIEGDNSFWYIACQHSALLQHEMRTLFSSVTTISSVNLDSKI